MSSEPWNMQYIVTLTDTKKTIGKEIALKKTRSTRSHANELQNPLTGAIAGKTCKQAFYVVHSYLVRRNPKMTATAVKATPRTTQIP